MTPGRDVPGIEGERSGLFHGLTLDNAEPDRLGRLSPLSQV
jgi:hypothetical protein